MPLINSFLILFGQSPALARAEFVQVLKVQGDSDPHLRDISEHLVEIKSLPSPASDLMKLLGGTVKIYQEMDLGENDAVEVIGRDVVENSYGHFTVTSAPWKNTKSMCQAVKNETQKSLVNPRFRLLKDLMESAGITEKYQEYHVYNDRVFRAVAAQDIDWWSTKDYDRPRVDSKSGMLPPKIARAMINMGLDSLPSEVIRLLDPFCGSGTILMEALDLGLSPIGSDISQKAVDDSRMNLDWFAGLTGKKHDIQITQSDVHHLKPKDISSEQVDLIVFEGYLGPPKLERNKVDNMLRGLGKLYLGTFKSLSSLLKAEGKVVCALPEFRHGNRVKNLDDQVVDACEKHGYTLLGEPMVYARDKALVARRIYVLQKTG